MTECFTTDISPDIVIVGGGPAGLAAALEAVENGISPDRLLILERDCCLGGILNQCIHPGFGLHRFGRELTGPEYAGLYIAKVREKGIPYLLDAMVLSVGNDKTVTFVSPVTGMCRIKPSAVILATGCRERPFGSLGIVGSRPSGIFTAGTAQKYLNIDGYMPGKRVVILGSGDIGLIMARRMTLEGAKVLGVCELMPYSGGLARNISQCLDDFGIPLYLSHTVTKVEGRERIERVTVSKVDENRKPIPGSEMIFDCDTLLLSCGLIPENDILSDARIEMDRVTGGAVVNECRMTCAEGIFACGNALHVHDLVDYVSEESAIAGRSAAIYVSDEKNEKKTGKAVASVLPGIGVRYVLPQKLSLRSKENGTKLFFRVGERFGRCRIVAKTGEKTVFSQKKNAILPSQMQNIVLTAEMCAGITEAGSVSVSVIKED